MTDAEIIKALPKIHYGGHGCTKCEYAVKKGDDRCGLKGCKIAREALDLINRQKAEIDQFADFNKMVDEVRAEAIREFAERLKERLAVDCDRVCERSSLLCGNISGYPIYEVEDCIDNTVKEMVGEEND